MKRNCVTVYATTLHDYVSICAGQGHHTGSLKQHSAEARFLFNGSIITYFDIIFTFIIAYFNRIIAYYYVIITSLLRHYYILFIITCHYVCHYVCYSYRYY